VEKQTGTTNLEKISGLGKVMPVTMACFVISGLAISGVPPLNGFFSKELVFDAALNSNPVFYIGALLGAFLTAISFLKLGRAAFFGDQKAPRGRDTVRESGFGMLLPMGVMAALCILFGLGNALPLDNMICPALRITEVISGWPQTGVLALISVAALLLAVCDHIYGSRKSGGAVKSADHIHYAPVLRNIYRAAEKGLWDPYTWLTGAVNGFTALCLAIERGIGWLYDDGVVSLVNAAGESLRRTGNGNLSRYLIMAVAGAAGVLLVFLVILQ
jgi:NADH:ubiquinone oxidoreductase subunit 5 (subunit L)/multisubunit Na+/H+ antiporter MnhA subunit